eukprot:CAMPEP_0179099556 /NCGR_PEP_ID=MMETSP0796-20121207/45933_1 /TAXON_ID=73915 /ORGANISM="Pyrodinium bahamense, Strain pbaha01" /LENGTH=113 /DNA_ID=CAMNT_0020797355 /DNA_START=376 /DNA_END=717 /DNA_ORIENTATION=+
MRQMSSKLPMLRSLLKQLRALLRRNNHEVDVLEAAVLPVLGEAAARPACRCPLLRRNNDEVEVLEAAAPPVLDEAGARPAAQPMPAIFCWSLPWKTPTTCCLRRAEARLSTPQ